MAENQVQLLSHLSNLFSTADFVVMCAFTYEIEFVSADCSALVSEKLRELMRADRQVCELDTTVCLKKNTPDIFSCNSRKHCQIFIIFGTHVTEKVSNQ